MVPHNIKGTNSLLWKINNSSYIMGTIHAYNPSIINIPKYIYKCIDQCDILALELADINISFSQMQKLVSVDDETYKLENYLSEEAFSYLINLETIDGNKELINNYKPLFITNILLKEYPELNSIESELLKYAINENKQIIGLEEISEQIAAIDAIPLEVQAKILEDSLLKGGNPLDELEKMMNFYAEQNIEKIKELTVLNSITNVFMENMQEKRNVTITERIHQHIELGRNLFIGVGALHLPDIDERKGIISLLKEKGHTLEPLEINLKPA